MRDCGSVALLGGPHVLFKVWLQSTGRRSVLQCMWPAHGHNICCSTRRRSPSVGRTADVCAAHPAELASPGCAGSRLRRVLASLRALDYRPNCFAVCRWNSHVAVGRVPRNSRVDADSSVNTGGFVSANRCYAQVFLDNSRARMALLRTFGELGVAGHSREESSWP